MTTSDFAKSLRLLADFYDAHPDCPAPLEHNISVPVLFGDTKATMAEAARALTPCRKIVTNTVYPTFELERSFGEIKLSIYTPRKNVCEQIKVGEALVPAHVIPAQPAKEAVPEQHVPETVQPLYEWRCHPLLADSGEQGSETPEPETATNAA